MSTSKDKPVYLILGATGGIGRSLCHKLSNRGATVVMAARDENKLQTLNNDVGGAVYPLDATQFEDVNAVAKYAKDNYGRIDGAVNCVGSILLKPAHLTSLDEYHNTLALNLHSSFYLLKAVVRTMMSQKEGSVILMSSAVARTGIVNHEAIASAKAGLTGLARSAASTYARWNIRVNCVAPGLVDTPMSQHIVSNEQAKKTSEAMHALGRLGDPDDVAEAIDWLLDATRSSWVTGQLIGVDGGLGTVRPR